MAKCKQPKTRQWFSVFVDNKRIETFEDSKAARKEIKRIQALNGVEIKPAANNELIAINAKTAIPTKMQIKFEDAARQAKKLKSMLADKDNGFDLPW